MTFEEKLFLEYPVPREVSVWGGDGIEIPIMEDISKLIELSVDELASDLQVTDYIACTGMSTIMPESTITVLSAKLDANYPFQGNRLVKVTYDKASNRAFSRYWPATITYRRKLTLDDLPNLIGDQLIYLKTYILWKMAEKELNILKTVNMEVDNGAINLETLEKFKDYAKDRYLKLKEEIFIYSASL